MSRRPLFLAVLLLLAGMTTFGASGRGIARVSSETKDSLIFDFGIEDYSFDSYRDKRIRASVKGTAGKYTTDKGAPEVMYFQYSFLLQPETDVIMDILDSHFTEHTLEDPLAPSSGSICRCMDSPHFHRVSGEIYALKRWYPQETVKLLEPFIARDRRGVSVQFYPFQYNPRTRILRVYDHIQIRLRQVQSKTARNALPMGEKALQSPSLFDNIFVNPVKAPPDHAIPEMGDMLVIYTARDAAAIQPYIQWKREKGFKVTTQQVATGTDVQSIIQDAYNENKHLLYVQLVGDWADIKGPATFLGEPLDVKMAEVAGTDNFPDLIIGRFCASRADEVDAQVGKSIAYEKVPDLTGDWYHRGIWIGGDVSHPSNSLGSNAEAAERARGIEKTLFSFLNSPYTVMFRVIEDFSWERSILAPIDEGVGFVNYSGRGALDELLIGRIANMAADGLVNGNRLFFLTAIACNTGDFSKDCLAEHLLKNPHGGAVCAWLSSIHQPWYPPVFAQDYLNELLTGRNDSASPASGAGITTRESRTSFGSLTYNAMALMYATDSSMGALDTMESFINFGDASLQLRTDTPKAVTATNTSQISTKTYVTNIRTDGVNLKGARVTITQGTASFTGVSDASGNVSIPHTLVSGTATLTVTGFNLETKYFTSVPVVASSRSGQGT